MSYKQIILVRKDLKMSQGKIAAQSSHASSECTLRSDKSNLENWRKSGMKKIILRVESLDELLKIKEEANKNNLTTSLIKDAGRTELEPGTITCLGIGPDLDEKFKKLTSNLKLL